MEGLTPRVICIIIYVFIGLVVFMVYSAVKAPPSEDQDIDYPREEFYLLTKGLILGAFWPIYLGYLLLNHIRRSPQPDQ